MKMKQILLVMILIFALVALAACNKPAEPEVPDNGNGEQQPPVEDEAKDITVSLDMLIGDAVALPASADGESVSYEISGNGAVLHENRLIAVAEKSTATLIAKTEKTTVTVNVTVRAELKAKPSGTSDTLGDGKSVALGEVKLSLGEDYALPFGSSDAPVGYTVSGSAVTLEGQRITAAAEGSAEVKFSISGLVFTLPVTVENHGTLEVNGMVIVRGYSEPVSYEFSAKKYDSKLSYYFGNSDKISINAADNTVKGLKTCDEVKVVAVSDDHTDVFSVEVVSKDSAKMIINAPDNVYANYPAKQIEVSFADERFASDVTFEVNNPSVFVENGKIYAKGTFDKEVTVTVKATSKYSSTEFTVKVSTFNKNDAEKKVQYYENYIIKPENKGGTIFVGDSYFDGYKMDSLPFWKDFYDDNASDEKFFLMGISSAQIDTLEIVSERIVYPMEPSEIVVHIGFNDVHHGPLTVNELYARIIALCEQYKERLPGVTVYFMGVEPKKNGYTAGTQYYESSTFKATALTEKMIEYAEKTDWFVYLDTMPIFVNSDGTINQSSYLSTDLSHPTLEAYDRIREVFREARRKNKAN